MARSLMTFDVDRPIFHIFLNTPVGRENLLQSAWLARQAGVRTLSVMIPSCDECVIYCSGTVVTLKLDETYTRFAATAHEHLAAILDPLEINYEQFEPSKFTGGQIPEIGDNWSIMACPRSMTARMPRIGLGFIGPKVRKLLLHAPFPVYIPAGAFKPWKSVVAFFGGPQRGINGVRVANAIACHAGVPLEIITQLGQVERLDCEPILNDLGVLQQRGGVKHVWRTFENDTLEDNLFAVPHDSLVVLETGAHSLMGELFFGSTLERVQTLLPNPLLICGGQCQVA